MTSFPRHHSKNLASNYNGNLNTQQSQQTSQQTAASGALSSAGDDAQMAQLPLQQSTTSQRSVSQLLAGQSFNTPQGDIKFALNASGKLGATLNGKPLGVTTNANGDVTVNASSSANGAAQQLLFSQSAGGSAVTVAQTYVDPKSHEGHEASTTVDLNGLQQSRELSIASQSVQQAIATGHSVPLSAILPTDEPNANYISNEGVGASSQSGGAIGEATYTVTDASGKVVGQDQSAASSATGQAGGASQAATQAQQQLRPGKNG